MLYNQPTGAATANDAFVGKNVGAGIQGSKVPPKAVEFPQREIVNALMATALSPTNNDLTQLAQAIATGLFLGTTGGTPNALTATLPTLAVNPLTGTPYQIPTLVAGMRFFLLVPVANTGAATLSIAGFATVPGAQGLTKSDGRTPLSSGDLRPGLTTVVWDGLVFRLPGLLPSDVYAGIKLSANYTLYVNASTGNDANPGTAALPLRTLQAAVNYVQQTLNLNGQVVTMNCSGAFTAGAKVYGSFLGSNSPIQFVFNGLTGSSVSVTNDVCFLAAYGASFTVQGFALSATGSSGTVGVGLYAGNASTIYHSGLTFGSCSVAHTYSQNASFINAVGNYAISGNAPYHAAVQGGTIQITSVTVTFTAPVTFTSFVSGTYAGFILSQSAIWSSIYAITGSRYTCSFGGGCVVYGAGVNYFPGSTAGSVSSATYGIYA